MTDLETMPAPVPVYHVTVKHPSRAASTAEVLVGVRMELVEPGDIPAVPLEHHHPSANRTSAPDPDAGLEVRPEFAAGLQRQEQRRQDALLKAYKATYRAKLACAAIRPGYGSRLDIVLLWLLEDMTDATRHTAALWEGALYREAKDA